MADLLKKPKACECAICGAVFYKYKRSERRVTCSRECFKKYQGEQVHRGRSGDALLTPISREEQKELDKLLHPKIQVKNCQFCPLGLTYAKDENGEYVCGNLKMEFSGQGAKYMKRPDRRCKANG